MATGFDSDLSVLHGFQRTCVFKRRVVDSSEGSAFNPNALRIESKPFPRPPAGSVVSLIQVTDVVWGMALTPRQKSGHGPSPVCCRRFSSSESRHEVRGSNKSRHEVRGSNKCRRVHLPRNSPSMTLIKLLRMSEIPKGLTRTIVRQTLDRVRSVSAMGARIAIFSEQFLNCPYYKNSLIGAVDEREVFTASFDGFDCVTYLETVVALARASTPDEFIDNLRNIRYSDGIVDWKKRNHYMTTWIRNNTRTGIVRDRTQGPGVVERRRCLRALTGMPARTVRVRSIPKKAFMRRQHDIQTGDLVFFASTRRDRDVFHCGLLIRDETVRIRHASLSQGQVVDQELTEFLRANRMSGVIAVRPRELDRTAQ